MANRADSADIIVGWAREPGTRGTWGILSSCVLTLFLCVYTAVHPNVPPKWNFTRDKYLYLARSVLWGLFAPEAVDSEA